MKITGETMIFKNDKGNYSTSVSNKREDGSYENMFISVNFKKGVEVENKTKINITNAFLSFYKTKDGLAKPKIVVMEFEVTSANTTQTTDFETFLDDNSDLPF